MSRHSVTPEFHKISRPERNLYIDKLQYNLHAYNLNQMLCCADKNSPRFVEENKIQIKNKLENTFGEPEDDDDVDSASKKINEDALRRSSQSSAMDSKAHDQRRLSANEENIQEFMKRVNAEEREKNLRKAKVLCCQISKYVYVNTKNDAFIL